MSNPALDAAIDQAAQLSARFAKISRNDRIEASTREGRVVFDRVNRGVTTERDVDPEEIEQELNL